MREIRLRAVGVDRLDRVGLLPSRETAILGEGDLVPTRSLTVVDHGGLAFFGEKTRAAEHAMPGEGRVKRGRLPRPVEHIGAGDVDEVKPRRIDNVVQMVGTVEKKCGVGIAGQAVSTGMHQVVAQCAVFHDNVFHYAPYFGKTGSDSSN